MLWFYVVILNQENFLQAQINNTMNGPGHMLGTMYAIYVKAKLGYLNAIKYYQTTSN